MSEEKKPHPFSKEAREAKLKEKELQQAEETLSVADRYPVDRDKKYIFKLLQPKKGNHLLGARSIVRDMNNDGVELTIRYVAGKTTLYEDEQGELRQGELKPFVFFNGVMEVDGRNELAVKFLLMNDAFEGNKNRISKKQPVYRLENPDMLLEAHHKRLNYEMQAMNIVAQKSFDDLKPLARVLLNLKDNAPELQVRNALLVRAKQDPDTIVKRLADPTVFRQYVIEKALEKNMISFDLIPDTFVWVASSKVIMSAKKSSDKNPVEQLANFTFSDKLGEQLFSDLEEAIK